MKRALTITEERYDRSGTRQRCTKCHKVAYPDQHTAETAAQRISERTPMRAYKGRTCGWWHVTTKKASRTRTRQRGRPQTHWEQRWEQLLADPRAHGVEILSNGRGFRRTASPRTASPHPGPAPARG